MPPKMLISALSTSNQEPTLSDVALQNFFVFLEFSCNVPGSNFVYYIRGEKIVSRSGFSSSCGVSLSKWCWKGTNKLWQIVCQSLFHLFIHITITSRNKNALQSLARRPGYPRRGSNPHDLSGQGILNPQRLPFRHSGIVIGMITHFQN